MKTILTILLSLLTIAGYGQRFRQGSQLYDFKLGMTIEEMKQVVDASLLEEVNVKDCRSLDILTLGSNLDGKIRAYFLAEYEVQPFYSLKSMYLCFFENKLFVIQISEYNKKTEDLLTQNMVPLIYKREIF